MKLYQALASDFSAWQNSHPDNGWKEKYAERIEQLTQLLPSGSGIDAGNQFSFEESRKDKLVVNSSYHVLDEHGMYDGWINYQVIIRPDFVYGFKVFIKGKFTGRQGCVRKDCSDIKEMLVDIYTDMLHSEV